MLAETGSMELLEWMVFLRMEDERLHGAQESHGEAEFDEQQQLRILSQLKGG